MEIHWYVKAIVDRILARVRRNIENELELLNGANPLHTCNLLGIQPDSIRNEMCDNDVVDYGYNNDNHKLRARESTIVDNCDEEAGNEHNDAEFG